MATFMDASFKWEQVKRTVRQEDALLVVIRTARYKYFFFDRVNLRGTRTLFVKRRK